VVNRGSKWNAQKRDASLTEFRRLLGSHHKDEVRNAERAGRALGRLITSAQVTIVGIDDVQLERYRRRFAVPQSLKAVMYAVATESPRQLALREEYAPVPERCVLCSHRKCRCVVVGTNGVM
jgi:hypothetical protein